MSRRGGRGGRRGGRGGARGAPRAPVWTPNPELYAQTNPEFGPGSQRIRIVSQEPALETKAALERSLCLLETGAREVVNDNSGNNNNNAPAPKLPERQDNNNTEEVKVADTVTSNGDAAFTTSGDPSVDLFFGGMVRGAGEDKVLSLLQASWAKNPQLTMQILLHGRDCRGGKGEKEVVLRALLWLRMVKPRTYLKNLRRFLDVGSYKDLVVLAERAIQLKLHPLGMTEPVELELLAEELKADAEKFRQWNEEVSSALEKEEAKEAKQEEPAAPDAAATDSEEKEDPKDKKKKKAARVSLSLACKWAPSEGAKFDRSAHLAKRLAKLLFPNQGKVLSLYRKFLTPLRTHCHIVEQLTCAGQWERINFGAVPAKAHNLLKKAFVKHTPEKYAKYIERLKVGKEKINTQGIQPHELAGQYVKGEAFNETIEAQWKTMIDKLKASGVKLSRALSLVDVSGSMSGTPMEVAIALGLVTATVCESAFHNMVLTFESNPHFFQIKEGSLFDKVNQLRQAPWGNSTNVLAAFDMILQTAVQMQVPADEMPHTLFIYSDMQFDTANSRRDNTETTFDVAKRNFAAAGYELPQVVFWNLRGDTHTLPTRNQAGVALVSGFSADLLKVFMEGGDFSPMAVLLRAVGKYEAEVDASEM